MSLIEERRAQAAGQGDPLEERPGIFAGPESRHAGGRLHRGPDGCPLRALRRSQDDVLHGRTEGVRRIVMAVEVDGLGDDVLPRLHQHDVPIGCGIDRRLDGNEVPRAERIHHDLRRKRYGDQENERQERDHDRVRSHGLLLIRRVPTGALPSYAGGRTWFHVLSRSGGEAHPCGWFPPRSPAAAPARSSTYPRRASSGASDRAFRSPGMASSGRPRSTRAAPSSTRALSSEGCFESWDLSALMRFFSSRVLSNSPRARSASAGRPRRVSTPTMLYQAWWRNGSRRTASCSSLSASWSFPRSSSARARSQYCSGSPALNAMA